MGKEEGGDLGGEEGEVVLSGGGGGGGGGAVDGGIGSGKRGRCRGRGGDDGFERAVKGCLVVVARCWGGEVTGYYAVGHTG